MGKKDEDIGDEQLAIDLLSEEERAALADDDEADLAKKIASEADDQDDDADADGADAADKKTAGDTDGDDDQDDGNDADDDGADAKTAEVDAADKAKDADADKQAAAEQPKLAPLDLSGVDQAYQEQLEQLDAGKAAKFKEMMDGEITAEEYSKFESKYLRDRDALGEERIGNVAWFKEVHHFKGVVLGEINYDADKEKFDAFDDWVKRLASNPKYADRDGRWYLEEAHRKVKLEFGIDDKAIAADKGAKSDKDAGKPANKDQTRKKAPDLTKIPKTLGNLPSASDDGDDEESGEFAHLNKLEGMDLERALAKMSKEQADRYLRS